MCKESGFALVGPFESCAGVQGAIYELKSPDGKDSGQLLKVLKFKAVLPITGNDIGGLHILLSFHARADLLGQFIYPAHTLWTSLGMHKHFCESSGLKREWIIGQHLNKLRGPKGELQGALAFVFSVFVIFQSCLATALVSSTG